jgi:protein-tyrosine sulfotransferase
MKIVNIVGSPIFIGGLMRSGTSLLRKMLGQHKNIFSGLETFWFELNWSSGLARSNEPLDVYLYRLGKFYEIDDKEILFLFNQCSSGEDFLTELMTSAMKKNNKSRWLEKTPANILHLDRIYSYWSNSKVIHILRDPRDVFASYKNNNKYGKPYDYGRLWSKYIGAAEDFKATLNQIPEQYIELRYENLVNEPMLYMKKILEFIDEPWDPVVSSFKGDNKDYELVKKHAKHRSTTLKQLANPLTNERIGTWKSILNDKEINEARLAIENTKLRNKFDELVSINVSS